jgi:hypothetical protein
MRVVNKVNGIPRRRTLRISSGEFIRSRGRTAGCRIRTAIGIIRSRGRTARCRIRTAKSIIRRLGAQRVVCGSDMAARGNLAPRRGWAAVRGLLPLTDPERATIAGNVVPDAW